MFAHRAAKQSPGWRVEISMSTANRAVRAFPSSMSTFTLAAVSLLSAGCAVSSTERRKLPPLETVQQVDLNRYLGTWYEIASFPQSFQKGCNATTANYALREDGQIDVVNRCRKGSLEGPEDVARGRARVVDPQTNARLEVSFFRPFWGKYWIIDLEPEYGFAVVGHPGRDYLWILSRSPSLDPGVYGEIVARLQAQGYETDRLVKTAQPTL
jgi:apolipoprotein D and lipocalin family protein